MSATATHSEQKPERRDVFSSHPLAGIPDDFQIRVEIAERLAYINQLAAVSTNPELLRWTRNKLSEPFATITRKLKEANEPTD